MPSHHAIHHESYDVTLPTETWGYCRQRSTGKRCVTVGPTMLADGLCMPCWDRSIQDKDSEHKRSYERSKRRQDK